jgi:hypothetical protein
MTHKDVDGHEIPVSSGPEYPLGEVSTCATDQDRGFVGSDAAMTFPPPSIATHKRTLGQETPVMAR